MKKWILLLLTLLIAGMMSAAVAAEQTTTIMMYMCGTNLQSDCLTDLKEMCAAKLTDNVRIVVLAGGASEWDNKQLKANRLNLFTIENGSFSSVTDWGRGSMGDAATLQRFVSYAWQSYPADRSVLVLWDHGGGMGDGVCFDEVFDNDSLTLLEIDQALAAVRKQDSSFHLALLGCDACMMGGYEIAVLAGQYADYYIGSEELEPGVGWYYTPWLNELAKDPGMSTKTMGENIIDTYIQGVKKERCTEYTTLSLVDTAALNALRSDMEQISAYMSQALNNGQLATISRMLRRTYSFGTYDSADESWDMYDLEDYLTICEQFAPSAVQSAREHLETCVVRAYSSGDVPTACGLSVFLPYTYHDYYLTDVEEGYDLSAYIPNAMAFAKNLASAMSGSNYVFQAAAPQPASMSDVVDTAYSLAMAFFDLIPGSTYNAETNTVGALPSFIAGSASQTATVANSLPSFIAGSANATAAPQTTTSTGSLPSFIAGSAGGFSTAALVSTESLAFSMPLSRDEVDNLSYVEGALFLDMSDDDGVFLLELGYMRNSWVDWNADRVCSAFDGTWSFLDGQMVVIYDQSKNNASRRSLIPVTVNGEETYLVVVFDGDSTTGRILGYNDGADENGLPIRRTPPLEAGDVIVPVYRLLYNSWEDWDDPDVELEEAVFEGDPIQWSEDLAVVYDTLENEDDTSDYQFAFYLNDIFGDYEMSDFFPFTM